MKKMVSLALGASVAAIAAASASPAAAQCAPDPTVANGTTTCAGVDADGLRVPTGGTTVRVEQGAIVTSATTPAVTIEAPPSGVGLSVRLEVAGRVDGGARAGVSVLTGPGFPSSFNPGAVITVASGGVVTGAEGVTIGQSGSNFASVVGLVDNAGTITGTGGVALRSTAPNYAGFTSVVNRAGGVMGAIQAPVGTLTNAGRIDGGARSAIDASPNSGVGGFGSFTNSGTIASASTTATIANMRGTTLTNSGTVSNTGPGAAVQGNSFSFLTINNEAAGRIASAGSVAISAGAGLTLTNLGAIQGGVTVAGPQGFTSGSRIDSSRGTIAGNLVLSAGDDVLVARYAGTRTPQTGVTGSINAGGGTNRIEVLFDANTTVTTPIDLLPGFQRLTLAAASGVTATLGEGFSTSSTVELAGPGSYVNRASLTTAGSVFATSLFSTGSPLAVVNEGAIRSTASGAFAVRLFSGGGFTNTGTIDAAGGGVDFSSQGQFSNSGTITAAGTGVSTSGPSGGNTGTIRSTGGTGLQLSGSSGYSLTNAGRIEGVTGAVIGSTLINTGTVAGSTRGVVVQSYGQLENRAGGVINGGVSAANSFNAIIANAGTINGDVSLNGSFSSFSSNRYISLSGGVLNGDLTLGQNDLLLTDLVNTGPGRFAGITGAVAANRSALRYRVGVDASAELGGVTGFDTVGYELANGATLTLTASATQTRQLMLAGQGAVDLTADFSTAATPAIMSTSGAFIPGQQSVPPNALAITSRGAITLVRDSANMFPQAAVVLTRGGFGSQPGDSFVNAGTISVRDRVSTSALSSTTAAVSGGVSVTNQGSILLDGGLGVAFTGMLTNSGAIRQVAGGAAARGVENVIQVVNSGVVEVAGTAVSMSGSGSGATSPSLVNSGSIISTGGVAIRAPGFQTSIENQAGGVITGRVAIAANGGTVVNAGTITGTVQLEVAPFGGVSFLPGAFASAGGTVNGSVLFGAGDDLFLQLDETAGVTGVIDGGGGFDVFGRAYSTSAAVALEAPGGRNFEAQLIQARGADTTVTITGEAANGLLIGGDGRIVNQATIGGKSTTYLPYGGYHGGSALPAAFGADLLPVEFRNEGTLRGGFDGRVKSFVNAGTIGAREEYGRGAFVGGVGDLAFANSGAIATEPFENAVEVSVEQARTITVENSGQVTGGFSAYADFDREDGPGTLSFRNTGTIASVDEETSGLYLSVTGASGAAVTLDNGGVLSAAGAESRALFLGLHTTYISYPDRPETPSGAITYAITNSGTIEADGGGLVYPSNYYGGPTSYTSPASALAITADREATGAVVNTATGRISATGERSTAIGVIGTALDLTNAGVIAGTTGTELDPADGLARAAGQTFLAGAIHAYSAFGDTVRNTGTITGSIDLGFGDDRIENRGLIDGAVFLRAGDDAYLQGAGGSLTGVVDGGDGLDVIAVDAAGGGAVAAERFANFERLVQSGAGVVGYSGAFSAPTLELSGGGLRVEAGRSFATAGPVAVTGSDAAETVEVAGVLNGAVSLGGGDDLFAEIGEGRATGPVDGGAGADLYRVTLAGDREGLSANTGFERLGVDGAGTLSLTLQQGFESATLAGAGLDVRLNGFAIGAVEGGAGAERFAADGDVARISMGAGDDAVRLSGASFAGLYEGGAGNDVLRLSGEGPATLSGAAAEFETVTVDGGALTITGALGGTAVSFGDGAQTLSVADSGRIQGAFDLGAGDDRFRLAAGGLLAGSVAGGAGRDAAAITLAGDRAFGANTLMGFELLSVDGAGALSLTLDQGLEAVTLSGVGLDVRLGGFAIGAVEGGAGAERFAADGDVVRVGLGAGDDLLSLGTSTLAGSYDGGAGRDALRLVGATTLTGRAVGFETLALEQATALTVRGVLSEAGERLLLGDGAQTIVNAGRIGGSLDFGGGDDLYVEAAGATLGGAVEGGAGVDLYRVTLAGDRAGLSATSGFERLVVDGSGTLSTALGQSFELVVLSGVGLDARLNGFSIGAVEGGAAAERFSVDGDVARVATGGGDDVLAIGAATPAGSYDGGAGSDLLRLTRASTLSAGRATDFELLSAEGANGLTLTGGAFAFIQVDAVGDLRVAADAVLAGAVRFGGGDNRFAIAGGYQGSVSGGAGVDAIEVSGGSAATPVAFGSIAEVEAFRMTGGFATLSGAGALGSVDLSGGRLVGLAGSVMSATAFNVRQGATFGSAGTVNGNVSVAGVLSPGASPGTMTVNGNVALQGTSVSVFEITPAASDRLVVNGALSIATGATLQIAPTGQLQPGASIDLITASAGITGSFTNVVKPDSLFGFLVQQGGRLSLLGQFRNDASFSGQVGSTIDYANSVLVGGRANAALLAAAPGLVGANGTSNAAAFALLAPEAYASARQAAVEQGLTLADAGRGAGFANRRAEPGLFTFGQFAADQRTLRADGTRGTARAKFGGYGLFGGLGYAGETWSLGGFLGYLDGRQRLDGRGATTELEGAVFGVHGRAEIGPFGLTATAAYAATEADTRRALPGGSARGTYDLTNLTLDVAATYEVAIGGEWSLKPRIGGTVVRVERDRVAETGSAAFAAQVAEDSDTAAFVDGALTAAKTGAVRPFATLGLRYQAAGRDSLALTGFGGGGLGLVVQGAERARVLGTAALGVEADLRPGLTLFSAVAAERGEDDRRESARIGVRLDF